MMKMKLCKLAIVLGLAGVSLSGFAQRPEEGSGKKEFRYTNPITKDASLALQEGIPPRRLPPEAVRTRMVAHGARYAE